MTQINRCIVTWANADKCKPERGVPVIAGVKDVDGARYTLFLYRENDQWRSCITGGVYDDGVVEAWAEVPKWQEAV